jgi:preprotein translocase subunit SecE
MSEVTQVNRLNGLKWALVVLLIAAAVIGNIYFGADSIAIRATVLIVVGVIALVVAANTAQGGRAWGFIKEARLEMRKVVWPTRQETVQTTAFVILIVVITALLLWGVDSVFTLLISKIVM